MKWVRSSGWNGLTCFHEVGSIKDVAVTRTVVLQRNVFPAGGYLAVKPAGNTLFVFMQGLSRFLVDAIRTPFRLFECVEQMQIIYLILLYSKVWGTEVVQSQLFN